MPDAGVRAAATALGYDLRGGKMMAWYFLSIIGACVLSVCVPAQDIAYFKFESGGGDTEINFGTPTAGVPRLGHIVTRSTVTTAQAWGPGKFGHGGLAAAPVNPNLGVDLDTGWDNVVGPNQSLTIAFFFKAAYPMPSNVTGVFCGPESNGDGPRMVISATPGTVGNVTLNWVGANGNGSTATLAQDLLTPSYSNWVHLAIVVTRSGTSGCYSTVVRWYVNGVAQIPQVGSGCFHDINGTSLNTFRIGSIYNSYFQFDEFRISLRAVPAAEIAQWASADRAAQAPFGDECHPFGTVAILDGGAGGLPVLGNSNYRLTVYGLPGTSVLLGLGSSDLQLNGLPLPLSLTGSSPALQGCFVRASLDLLTLPGTIGANGALTFPLPIPQVPALTGITLYSQAFMTSSILATQMITNAYAIAIGV